MIGGGPFRTRRRFSLLRPTVSRILFTLSLSKGLLPGKQALRQAQDRRPFLCDSDCSEPVAIYPRRLLPPGARKTLRIFDLAAGGVCLATRVTTSAVRSYRTISPLPSPRIAIRGLSAVSFLLHFPLDYSTWTLSSTVPCAVRTFLIPTLIGTRSSHRPHLAPANSPGAIYYSIFVDS